MSWGQTIIASLYVGSMLLAFLECWKVAWFFYRESKRAAR